MELTLHRSSKQRKNERLVIFNIEGRPGSVQFFRAPFPKDGVPATLRLTGTFAESKPKETPEQRKLRLAARTPAERLAVLQAVEQHALCSEAIEQVIQLSERDRPSPTKPHPGRKCPSISITFPEEVRSTP